MMLIIQPSNENYEVDTYLNNVTKLGSPRLNDS